MLVLRKNLNRPLAPSEMDGNFRLIDEALKRAEYGDGPYPVADYIFDGATVLPGGIDFSRPGDATYIRDGQLLTAGVDEPVFEDGGLRLEPQVTNIDCVENLTGWSRQEGAALCDGQALGDAQFYRVIAAQGIPNCRITSQSCRGNRSSTHTLSVVIKRGTESWVTIQGQTYLSSPPYNSTSPRHNVNI